MEISAEGDVLVKRHERLLGLGGGGGHEAVAVGEVERCDKHKQTKGWFVGQCQHAEHGCVSSRSQVEDDRSLRLRSRRWAG